MSCLSSVMRLRGCAIGVARKLSFSSGLLRGRLIRSLSTISEEQQIENQLNKINNAVISKQDVRGHYLAQDLREDLKRRFTKKNSLADTSLSSCRIVRNLVPNCTMLAHTVSTSFALRVMGCNPPHSHPHQHTEAMLDHAIDFTDMEISHALYIHYHGRLAVQKGFHNEGFQTLFDFFSKHYKVQPFLSKSLSFFALDLGALTFLNAGNYEVLQKIGKKYQFDAVKDPCLLAKTFLGFASELNPETRQQVNMSKGIVDSVNGMTVDQFDSMATHFLQTQVHLPRAFLQPISLISFFPPRGG